MAHLLAYQRRAKYFIKFTSLLFKFILLFLRRKVSSQQCQNCLKVFLLLKKDKWRNLWERCNFDFYFILRQCCFVLVFWYYYWLNFIVFCFMKLNSVISWKLYFFWWEIYFRFVVNMLWVYLSEFSLFSRWGTGPTSVKTLKSTRYYVFAL